MKKMPGASPTSSELAVSNAAAAPVSLGSGTALVHQSGCQRPGASGRFSGPPQGFSLIIEIQKGERRVSVQNQDYILSALSVIKTPQIKNFIWLMTNDAVLTKDNLI